jgi:carboxyl-terminal processing protease
MEQKDFIYPGGYDKFPDHYDHLYNYRLFQLILLIFLFVFTGCASSPKYVVGEAYNTIISNHLDNPSPEVLVDKALIGMQTKVGEERLSFRKTGHSIEISSSGQSTIVTWGPDKKPNRQALEKICAFISMTNPQFSEKTLYNAAIEQMLTIDSGAEFFSNERYNALFLSWSDDIGTTGLELHMVDGQIIVITTIEGGPAFRAGILPKDIIMMIDGKTIENLSLEEVIQLFRGKIDTNITITVSREGIPEPIEFNFKREHMKKVNFRVLQNNSLYIRANYNSIDLATDLELDKKISELNKINSETIKGIVLDLRDNKGGLLNQAINMVSHFSRANLIVSIKDKTKYDPLSGSFEGATIGCPLIILVNEKTAAGAEIVAGVLQEFNRALIIGVPTYKMNTIYTLFPLQDDSAIKLKTAIWLLPSGRSIETTGIIPDLDISKMNKSDKKDIALTVATQILSEMSSGTIENLRAIAQDLSNAQQVP